MYAKLFEPLKDERKQIGCMSGFIHLFEPNQAALPKRITNTMSIRTLQGNSQVFRGSCEEEETTNPYVQHGSEMRSTRNSNDKFRVYTESSRASCSSSPSSSFSSVDYSKVTHPDPSSYDRIIFPESPLLDRSLSLSSSSWRMRQRSFDLDDAVKDLSFATDRAEQSMLLKPQDSLRPSPRAPLKANDSLCFYNDDKQNPSRLLDESNGNNYERTELECNKHESKETRKNYGTLDELARLSLDSSTESNSGLGKTYPNQRSPSIVGKLMGLEAIPGATSFNTQITSRLDKIGERKDSNMIQSSASPAITCIPIQIQVSSSQRSLRKDHAAHKWKNGELVMKPSCSSRILIEPAPWKQPELNRTLPKTAVERKQGKAYEPNGFTALYSKFEGRLNDIEFQRSSKDLRALKQMLDAVQQNQSWQVENKVLSEVKPMQQQTHQKACISVVNGKQERCVKTMKSPIVLMKPIKLLAKSDIAASSVIRSEGTHHILKPQGSDSAIRNKSLSNTQTAKGQNRRNGCKSPHIRPSEKKLTHTKQKTYQPLLKEQKVSFSVFAGSGSPRMQQKKPQSAIMSHDAMKLSVPTSKHPGKFSTIRKKSQPKHSLTQQCNGRSSGITTESKVTSCEDDTEVTSKLRLDDIHGGLIPARKVVRPVFSGIRKHKPCRIFNEDTQLAHTGTVATEQPSPVSVLDPAAYREDPPSPLIKKMASFGTAEIVARMSRERLKQIENLVHKLNGVGSTYNEPNTDFIESLCQTTNPDQRYISKILLASGFLFRDFESSGTTFQPHITGYPINPELFFVLEQTKSSALPTTDHNRFTASKSHRRLIFDSCNEILAEMLYPSGLPNDSRYMHKKLAKRNITARLLLNNMCDRIEQLQVKDTQHGKILEEEGQKEDDGLKKIVSEDMMLKSEKWGNFEIFVPEVVLGIERMLFKDLVKEIVSDEAVSYALESCHRKLHFNKT